MERIDVLEKPYQPTKDWNDSDWNKFSTWLKGMLNTTEVTVTFTKKDGTERVMKCTLDPKQLPPVPVVEGKKERKKSEDTIAVYDLEVGSWRSFTIKSVTKVATILG